MWPMSRASRPKQFFNIVGDQVLIRDTYERLAKSFAPEDIYFSLSPALEPLLREHFPEVEADHLFLEPEKRDTGPAMGFVAAALELTDPDEPIVFIPSDHYIRDEELFLTCLRTGEKLIRETGKLVDIGVTPTFPSTVLGYTQVGEPFKTMGDVEVFAFAGHTEKPDYEVAKQYVEDGSYLWHANYYMWTPRKFVEAFERYAPETGAALRDVQKALRAQDEAAAAEAFGRTEKISIDYAVTEKMDPSDVLIIRGDFGWSDIGAWDTLHDRLSGEDAQNVTKGQAICIDTKRSLIYGPKEKLVAVIGMEGVVVVDTQDTLLVCRLEDAQRVKDVVKHLQESGHESFL